jgi:hypothetical protein
MAHIESLMAHINASQPGGSWDGVQEELPAVRDELGELRVLENTLSPCVALLFQEHIKACPLVVKGGNLQVAECSDEYGAKNLARQLRQLLKRFVRWDATGTATLAQHGPGTPNVRGCDVPETDDRKGLRGKKGLEATTRLRPFQFFGLLRCYVMTSREYRRFLRVNLELKPAIDAYTYEHPQPWQPMKLDERGRKVNNGEAVWLVCMGYGYANDVSLLNAPQLDPMGLMLQHGDARFDEHRPGDVVAQPNAALETLLLGGEGGFPVAAGVVLDKAVKRITELLACYKRRYWETQWWAEEEAEEVLQLKQTAKEVCVLDRIPVVVTDNPLTLGQHAWLFPGHTRCCQ